MNYKFPADHPMRDTYIEFASSTVERGEFVVNILSKYTNLKGKRYLDVGCGYGGFPIAFAMAGVSEAIGIDINSELINLAHNLVKDYSCPVQPNFLVCDILNLDEKIKLGKFDIITCNDVIEHVSSPSLLIERLSTLLNNHGILYMEIPNAFNYNMIFRDGHYGLFGISLLDPINAKSYFEYIYKNQIYDVGEYLDFYGYLKLFRSYGFEPILLNENPENEEEIHRIAKSIKSLWITKDRAMKVVPESLKNHMEKVLDSYIRNFLIHYEKFLSSKDKIKKIESNQLYNYYGIEFWRFLLKKRSIVIYPD